MVMLPVVFFFFSGAAPTPTGRPAIFGSGDVSLGLRGAMGTWLKIRDGSGQEMSRDILVGGLVAMNFIFPLILGFLSSQLTNSFFQRGGQKPPTRYSWMMFSDVWWCFRMFEDVWSRFSCYLEIMKWSWSRWFFFFVCVCVCLLSFGWGKYRIYWNMMRHWHHMATALWRIHPKPQQKSQQWPPQKRVSRSCWIFLCFVQLLEVSIPWVIWTVAIKPLATPQWVSENVCAMF